MTSLYPPEPLTSLETLRDTDAMLVARSWLESETWGLLLLGDVGRGKSCAAAWLHGRLERKEYRESVEKGWSRRQVLWIRAREVQRYKLDERGPLLRKLAGAYGLVVDELGMEDHYANASPRGALLDVIEERADRGAFTIMTTNLPGEAFAKLYGDRLVSRLRAGGVVDGKPRWSRTVTGPDLRGAE